MKQKPNVQRIRMLMRAENRNHTSIMGYQPKEIWPANTPPGIIEVWRSNKFLAQVYQEAPEVIRISVCRTMITKNGGWEEDISWEELMQIKREIGHADSFAVEVYPMDKDIVNVANMRHIFVLPQPIVGWRKDPPKEELAAVEACHATGSETTETEDELGYDPHWDDPEG